MHYFLTILAVALLFVSSSLASLPLAPEALNDSHTVYWSEDWETGMGLWSASNGVWEVGTPSYGTSECYGNACAGTHLDGQYPYGTYSELESTAIDLPADPADGVLWLGLWHWFSNSTANAVDYGCIRIWDESSDQWTEVTPHYIRNSMVWSPYYLDISEYAGLTIRVGFLFNDEVASGTDYEGPGWYVDEIRIFDGHFPDLTQINRFDQKVDGDWGGWYPTRGVWELGEPTSGIDHAYSEHRCFGTVLDGHYPYGAYSRLTSPPTTLPGSPDDGRLYFSFKQYCSLSRGNAIDEAQVQIDDGTGWTTLYAENWHNNLGSQWVERTFDISEYTGQRVRFGFLIDDNAASGTDYESHGLYIDDLQFSEGARYLGNPERFENYAPNWLSTRGIWEVGEPTHGPADVPSGTRCWGTNLDGDYPYGASDMLMTPEVTLASSGLFLRFQHWYSFSQSNAVDYGVVRIRVSDGEWTDISGQFVGSSGGWSQYTYDLSSFTGETVQFGFQIVDRYASGTDYESSGWYIDDFEIVGMPQDEAPLDPIYFSVTISPGPAELVFVHPNVDMEKVIVYGSPVADFLPSLGTRLAILPGTATSWTDEDRPGWPATFYRVSVVDALGNECVPVQADPIVPVPDGSLTPQASHLLVESAVPNPFNPTTRINFTLSHDSEVEVVIHDVSGRKVADVLHREMGAGRHSMAFTPVGLASGTYFATVRACNQSQTIKIMLEKSADTRWMAILLGTRRDAEMEMERE